MDSSKNSERLIHYRGHFKHIEGVFETSLKPQSH